VTREESRMFKVLATVVRVAAADDNKRFDEVWKELSRGER